MGPRTRNSIAWTALIALFILIAAIRIGIAYQSPLSDYEGYAQLRQVRSVMETGRPLFEDDLSYSGRSRIVSPFYPYFLALFGLFLPEQWLFKVLPNIFAALVVFPSFWFARTLTGHDGLAVATAAITGLVPAFFLVGINDGSPVTLALSLLVLAMHLFVKSRKSGKHLDWLLLSVVFLTLLHPLSLVFVMGLLCYTALLRLQRTKVMPKDVEILLFALFFNAWFSLIIYKKAFVAHGVDVIWQNIPGAELAAVFSRITLLQAISSTGFVTLILGVIGLYYGLTQTRRKSIVLLAGMLIASLMLVWFRLVELATGLALLSIMLALSTGYALFLMYEYVKKTKASKYAHWSVAGVLAVFIIAILPGLLTVPLTATPSQADLEVLGWAKEHLDVDAIIVGSPVEGSMIASVAGRKNVIDTDYLLIPRVEERYEDVLMLYRSLFKTDAIGIMQKYGATHLYVSGQTASFSGVPRPRFLVSDDHCFSLVRSSHDGSAELYERRCSLRGERGG